MTSEILQALRQAIKPMITPDIYVGQVKKFDADKWTADIELNQGATVTEVTVKAVLNDEATGILVKPKLDSYVLVGTIDGRLENSSILLYSEIEEIRLLSSGNIQLRGDEFGGIVKMDPLKSNLDAIKNYLTTLKTAIETGFVAVGVGSAANGPGGKTAFSGAMSSSQINFQDMENKKVTHG